MAVYHTIALAHWHEGFYERLIGMVKKSLRKVCMGGTLLYWDKLTTFPVDVEAVLNNNPLTHMCKEFKSGFCFDTCQFLIGNCNNTIPFNKDDIEDEMEYCQR